jgi:hypothetical protein
LSSTIRSLPRMTRSFSLGQLEQAYDAPGDEAPRPQRDDDFSPEQLMHELEDFLRQEREGRGD